MPNYIKKELTKYRHRTLTKRQNCLYALQPVKNGKELQTITDKTESEPLSAERENTSNTLLAVSFTMHAQLT